ncbi:MAG: precorrin-2 C(20)-methyltransferase [Desulfobacca sp. 4484_104]|nr:MAG: precorrin-2 C(20)-methyltransferase [Desulfobacca sp. 4484_104]RLA88746.1 MAG: precorrin-2 C(20)-methyltransferase [Deltaproteobacteria bacterium]
MSNSPGTLYGIGVGPGDPELITLKALRVLKQVPYIFAPGSTKNDYSLALNIVSRYLNQARIEYLPFPMTTDRDLLQAAWEQNARTVLRVLTSGQDAAFITIGDPLTYSTFGYLLRTVKNINPAIKVITIPGITSYHAAAARANIPLVEGDESFYLVSGAGGAARFREAIATTENMVMLKTYRYFGEIYQVLDELNLLDRALCISFCGLEGETIVQDLRTLKDKQMSYLSLIIIRKQSNRS